MPHLSSINVPLASLICKDCRCDTSHGRTEKFLAYQAHDVVVEGSDGQPSVTVSIDVQKVNWRRVAHGEYRAYALISFFCPGCDHAHEIRHQLEAPLLFLKNIFMCKSCRGPLKIEDETIEYFDTSETGPKVEVHARLVCSRCATAMMEKVAIPSPSLDTLQRAGEVDIELARGAIKPHRRTVGGNYRFLVALSFPGPKREFVRQVAKQLAETLGAAAVFFDEFYEEELARPNLDAYLQSIYQQNARLVVVFLCDAYEQSDWCGLEWRAVRDLLKTRKSDSIMLMRFGETELPGLFSIDGYVNLDRHTPDTAAMLIRRRLNFETSATDAR